jgi:hypothetical protein
MYNSDYSLSWWVLSLPTFIGIIGIISILMIQKYNKDK